MVTSVVSAWVYLIEDQLELSRAGRASCARAHAEVFPLERCVREVARDLT